MSKTAEAIKPYVECFTGNGDYYFTYISEENAIKLIDEFSSSKDAEIDRLNASIKAKTEFCDNYREEIASKDARIKELEKENETLARSTATIEALTSLRISELKARIETAEKLLEKSRSYFNTKDCFGDIIYDIDNYFN